MKLILSCFITALLTFFVGTTVAALFNPDWDTTRCIKDYRLNLRRLDNKPNPEEMMIDEKEGLRLSSQPYDKVRRDIFKFAPACKLHRPFQPTRKLSLK
ncbi:MAG TPA: hypothetical protein VF779_06650 [Pyrinomonadaceae bacterium]